MVDCLGVYCVELWKRFHVDQQRHSWNGICYFVRVASDFVTGAQEGVNAIANVYSTTLF
jgi:hypothetical protein